jgi:TonB family protein
MKQMIKMSKRYRAGSRFRIVTFAIAFSLATLGSPLASVRPATDDVLNLWSSPTFGSFDERNIEQFATAQIQPSYPTAAQKYRIQGTVTVEVSVSKDGKVEKAQFLRGHSIFKSVSIEAAKQWQFDAAKESNLEGTINFTFRLN